MDGKVRWIGPGIVLVVLLGPVVAWFLGLILFLTLVSLELVSLKHPGYDVYPLDGLLVGHGEFVWGALVALTTTALVLLYRRARLRNAAR